jgi:hypothetical protein
MWASRFRKRPAHIEWCGPKPIGTGAGGSAERERPHPFFGAGAEALDRSPLDRAAVRGIARQSLAAANNVWVARRKLRRLSDGVATTRRR